MVTIKVPTAISGISRAKNKRFYRSTRLTPHINLIDTGHTTAMRCNRSLHTEVAVECATMRMAVRDRYMANTRPGHWHGWGVPTSTSSSDAGEQYAKQRMIAALCDNVVGAK